MEVIDIAEQEKILYLIKDTVPLLEVDLQERQALKTLEEDLLLGLRHQ